MGRKFNRAVQKMQTKNYFHEVDFCDKGKIYLPLFCSMHYIMQPPTSAFIHLYMISQDTQCAI